MQNELIERRMIELVPDLAKHYLTFNTYEAQRSIRNMHVQELIIKMKEGDFRYGNVAFAQISGNGQMLVDGQHLCYAVLGFGSGIPAMMEKWKCPNENYLARLYRQFNLLGRSARDCAKAKHVAMGFDWPAKITNLSISALGIDFKLQQRKYSDSNVGRGPQGHLKSSVTTGQIESSILFTLDQRTDLIDDHLDEVMFFAELLRNPDLTFRTLGTVKHINKAVIIMMLFRTFRMDEQDSRKFWTDIIYGQHLFDTQPSYHLREFLINARSFSKLGTMAKVNDHEYIARITRAWNTFRTQKGSPKSIYLKAANIPDLI